MRINKYLALCGAASRRKAEQLVLDGRVQINGKKVDALACDVGDNDTVSLDGKKVEPIHKHIYLMVNKPKGFICTVSDEKDRKTVMELVPQKYKDKRLFPVGRLDYDTEGLLLMTTDGDFCNRLMHPRNEIPKTYAARIEGDITEDELNKIRAGVILDGRKTNRCKAKVVAADGKVSRVEIVISEGRNRQVRRMFEAINREVVFLKRVAIGDIRLGGLGRGLVRELTPDEVEYLRRV